MSKNEIESAWQVLDLQILKPAVLDGEALLAIRHGFHNREWRDQNLPIPVAHVTPEFQTCVMVRAQRVASNPRRINNSRALAAIFREDIAKINKVLFGVGLQSARGRAGFFAPSAEDEGTGRDSSNEAKIHADFFGEDRRPFYVTRIGAIPFGYIRVSDLKGALPEQQSLVVRALDEDLRPELQEAGLLKSATLGDVMLLASVSTKEDTRANATSFAHILPLGGTLHCGGIIPERREDRVSAFARCISLPPTSG